MATLQSNGFFTEPENITNQSPREDYSDFHQDWTVGGEWGGKCMCVSVCVCLCVLCVREIGVIVDIHYNEVFNLSHLPQLLKALHPMCSGFCRRKVRKDGRYSGADISHPKSIRPLG